MTETPKIFTLRQVVGSIRKTVEERYHSFYWVKAEMHKLNLYPSGHAFPELVQKEEGKIVAQINGSIWKHNLQGINKRFIEVLKEPLKEGSTLLMLVKVSFSELYGISLQIQDIDPNYSLGELQRERQETLLKLEKLGLINRNQQLSFPLLPQRIAIISADTSKGLSDFMKVLDHNPRGYDFQCALFQAALQGDGASLSIRNQLQLISEQRENFDCCVIVRGGGGEVGMSCYNNFELCQAIAEFPIPVLTGIGHSTNLTVAEMIAFRNAITPTELAGFLLEAFDATYEPIIEAEIALAKIAQRLLDRENQTFSIVTNRFKSAVRQSLMHQEHVLKGLGQRLGSGSKMIVQSKQQLLDFRYNSLQSSVKNLFRAEERELVEISDTLRPLTENLLDKKLEKLTLIVRQVNMLHPDNVLRRGFAIVRKNNQTVNPSNAPKLKDVVDIQTMDYRLTAEITKIENYESGSEL